MNKLLLGIIYGVIAQVITYFQLQGNIKWNLMDRYPILMYMVSLPLTFLYVKSVQYFVEAFDGRVWPARLIGFAVGIIVFTFLTHVVFKEQMTWKTIITLVLSIVIILIQIFWK